MAERPIGIDFDTRALPSMGDPDYVDAQVRLMAREIDDIYQHYMKSRDADAHLAAQQASTELVTKWTKHFAADNTALVQTLSPEGQVAWLKAHGFGSDDDDPHGPVTALVASTVN